MEPVKLIIIGAGSRGTCYSKFALQFPEHAKVVAVAEPRNVYRESLVKAHNIPDHNIFRDWCEVLKRPKFADAVVIATQDDLHTAPAIAFADLKYNILLEKPMATNPLDCSKIVEAAIHADILFAVCHVLRYTKYTQTLKQLIDSGRIGEIVSMQHLEPVGYWHQAHSYVRGNWRKESITPMLLAKSCHDLDWIRYIMNSKCLKISSFATLKHFRHENMPTGAAKRCLECSIEAQCPYSAKKIYINRALKNDYEWPVNVLTSDTNVESVYEELRTGPYGRCVYACDNDVVDNQVVNMLFEDKKTASFTMTAFTKQDHRYTRIFGTRGEIIGDGLKIKIHDFLSDQTDYFDIDDGDPSIVGGHGGGDFALMANFVEAVRKQDSNLILSGPEETLETHMMVFAAEQARHNDIVVTLKNQSF